MQVFLIFLLATMTNTEYLQWEYLAGSVASLDPSPDYTIPYPGGLQDSAFALMPDGESFVVFGGVTHTGQFGSEVWRYWFGNNSFTLPYTAPGNTVADYSNNPGGVSIHSMVMLENGSFITFGGFGYNNV